MIRLVVAVTLAVVIGLAGNTATHSIESGPHYSLLEGAAIAPGRVLARAMPGTSLSRLETVAGSQPGEVFPDSDDPTLVRWWEFSVTPGSEREAVKRLGASGSVEWAEPVAIFQAGTVPDDPCYDVPVGSECQGQDQWGAQVIGAPAAWDVTHGNPSTKIAVVDSGIAFGHPDLLPNYGGENGSGDNCQLSDPGHATHVGGIASAATDNGMGIAGIGWSTKLVSYRVLRDAFDSQNQRWKCVGFADAIANGIRQAADDGSQVINMSFAGPDVQIVEDAVVHARSVGAVLVGGAGNEGLAQSEYPAGYDGVISVAASGHNDERAIFSNYGTDVDIAAPGVDIISTVPPSGYAAWQGTSMATPFVSGTAALLAGRGFSQCEIEDTILGRTFAYPNGGDPALVDSINWAGGVGRLNAGEALTWWPAGTPIATPGNIPEGALLKDELDGKMYLVRGGTRYQIDSQAEFNQMGLDERKLQCVPDSMVTSLPSVPADKTVLREFGSGTKYVVDCGASFDIADNVYQMLVDRGYISSTTYEVPPGTITSGNPIKFDPEETYSAGGQFFPLCNLREVDQNGNPLPDNYIICSTGGLSRRSIAMPSGSNWVRDRVYSVSGVSPAGSLERRLPPYALANIPITGDLSGCQANDIDGLSNLAENYIGTNPNDACANTSARNDEATDANPFDNNDDQDISMLDVSAYSSIFGKLDANLPVAKQYRFDLNQSGTITITDVSVFSSRFGTTCGGGLGPDGPSRDGPGTDMPTVDVAIDTDALNAPANTANSLGSLEQCTAGSVTTLASGTSTGGNTGTTLNDTSQSFAPNAFASKAVAITAGAGAGQVRMITGNTSTQLAVTPAWSVVPNATSSYAVQETLLVDVTVSSIPAYDSETMTQGLVGLGFNFTYDGSKMTVLGVNPNGNADTILASSGPLALFGIIDGDANSGPQPAEPLPSISGNVRIDMADLTMNYDSGSGVMVRLVLLPTASGTSTLSLADVVVGDAASEPYEVNVVGDSQIVIGGTCP